MAPDVLVRRAEALASTLERPSTAALLNVLAHRLGGDRDKVKVSRTELQEVVTRDLHEIYEVELASFLAGGDPVTQDLRAHVLAAFRAVDTGGEKSPAEFVYQAAWLAGLVTIDEELADALGRVFAARYSGELKRAGLEDVCARALIMSLVIPSDIEAEGLEGETIEGKRLPSLAAYEFVGAFADTFLAAKGLNKAARPLRNITRFFDAQAFALMTDRRGGLPITVDKLRSARFCADALLGAFGCAGDVGSVEVQLGIDALVMLVAGALHPFFLD
jgi:hypothetical protein